MGYTPERKRIKRSSQDEERLPLNRERFPRNRERLDQDSNGREERLISKREKLPSNRERLDQDSTEENSRTSITGGKGEYVAGCTTKFTDLPTGMTPTIGVRTLGPLSQVDREILDLEKLEKLAAKLEELTSNMLESEAFQDGRASRTAKSVFQPAFLESESAFLESASQGAESSAFQEWKASRTAESAFQVENYSKRTESVAFKELKSVLEAVKSADQEWKLASEVSESASNRESELVSVLESAFLKWISASQLAIKSAQSTFQGGLESAAFQGSESAFHERNLATQVEESASKVSESASKVVESAFQDGLELASFQEWYSASQVEESASQITESASKFSESAYNWMESLSKWSTESASKWIEKMTGMSVRFYKIKGPD